MVYLYINKMIGYHIDSNIKNILNEISDIKKNKCNIVQLFIDPFYKKYEIYEEFKKYAKINNIKIVIHASYTINIAQNWNNHSWWIKQFILEIESANKIGAFAIVVHLGKQLNISNEEALNNMFTSLLYVHNETKKIDIKILIETSTGQGTEMCYRLEDLAHFYRKFSNIKNDDIKDRFGICLDTCHIFSAGYDISNKKKIEMFLDIFDEMIGINNIKLIHLNDSKKELGSNIDRHENIGFGSIGKKGLFLIYKFFSKLKVPIILETPLKYIENDLKLLK